CSQEYYEQNVRSNNEVTLSQYIKACRGETKVVGFLPSKNYRLECEVEAEKAKVVDGFTNRDDKYYFIEACIREKEKSWGQSLGYEENELKGSQKSKNAGRSDIAGNVNGDMTGEL